MHDCALIAAVRQVKTRWMEDPANLPLDAGFAAALEWWRNAGIDHVFHDDPTCWTEPAEKPANAERPAAPLARPVRPNPAQPAAPAASDPSTWPTELSAFTEWWLSEAWLDQGRTEGRVAPRGPLGAELMVIVPEPEREDREKLLSGPAGRMLDAILSAMGHDSDQVYVASALPRHTPMADWAELARRGMGEALCHHVRLASPKRLIAFGGNIPPLFGNTPPQRPAILEIFKHEELSIPLLAARDLAALMERPRWKAGLWQAWLEWAES